MFHSATRPSPGAGGEDVNAPSSHLLRTAASTSLGGASDAGAW